MFLVSATMNTYCIIMVLCLIPLTGASESWIVGGKTAKPHSRKYMASLQCNREHNCGGFLIRDDFVLTAAHCKCTKPETEVAVVLGAHNITNKKEQSQQRIQVEEYFQHPDYYGKYKYDIMLLKLKEKAKLDEYVRPIELLKEDIKIPPDTKCSVAGWGKTKPTKESPASDVLREAVEKILNKSECKRIWRDYFNPDNMICTTFNNKDGSMCQGDSGGPLICKNKTLGIAAFTKKGNCSDPNVPHGYTKISSFLPWIKKVMNGVGNVA